MGSNVYEAPFYKPNPTATNYPSDLEMGEVRLYRDGNWTSEHLSIQTNDTAKYPAGMPFTFVGSGLNDKATWIAFKLAKGAVCTLFEHPMQGQRSNYFDFSGVGRCVDLIGNDAVQTVDLVTYGANDCLSGGVWREVDTTDGWFQIFKDINCNGIFNTIFFDEWPSFAFNSVTQWYLNDQASSINFPCLTPPQLLELVANPDGGGYNGTFGASNPFGTYAKPATVNLTERGINDTVSAFKWSTIAPKKVSVASVTEGITETTNAQWFTETVSFTNDTEETQSLTVTVAKNVTSSVSNTTTTEYSMSATVGASVTTSVSEFGGEISGTISTSFTTSITNTTSKQTTTTQEFDVAQQVNVTVPKKTTVTGTIKVGYGDLPFTTVSTTGVFYYDQNLPGSEKEALYKLPATISVNIEGGCGTQAIVDLQSSPALEVVS